MKLSKLKISLVLFATVASNLYAFMPMRHHRFVSPGLRNSVQSSCADSKTYECVSGVFSNFGRTLTQNQFTRGQVYNTCNDSGLGERRSCVRSGLEAAGIEHLPYRYVNYHQRHWAHKSYLDYLNTNSTSISTDSSSSTSY
jgi:hypothetical protein